MSVEENSITKRLEFHRNEFQKAFENSDFGKAVYEGKQIVEFSKNNYGEIHSNVAKSFNNLAIVYKAMGDYDKAIDCHNQSLEIYRQLYIETHPTIAKNLKNISSLYNSKGDLKKSIEYYEDHLYVSIKAMGDKHPYIGETCNNIALLCIRDYNYKEAINYYIRSLNIFKKVYGENHIQVAHSFKNLGKTYQTVGEYDTSIENYNKSIQVMERIQGENSLDIAQIFSDLGSVYDIKELYDKAIQFYNKSLDIRLKMLGMTHSDVAACYNNIGTVYLNKAEYSKALEYYEKDLKISIDVFGENHLNVATTYNNIGLVYDHIGDYEKAIEYYQKDLEISTNILGRYHSDVATSYNNIALTYLNEGDYNKAFENYNYSIGIYRKVFGDNHPMLASGYINLGTALAYKKRFDRALEFYNNALKIQLEYFGENSKEVAQCYYLLGEVYVQRNEIDLALEYFNKSLSIRVNVLGDKNPEIAETISKIGTIYSLKEDYDKSIEYYNKSLAIQYRVHSEIHPDIAQNYINLGRSYECKSDYNKVFFYYQKALTVNLKIKNLDKIKISRGYANIGRIYSNIGNYENAIENYNRALDLAIEKGVYSTELAEIYNALGRIYTQKTEYDTAIKNYNQALDIFKVNINNNRLNIALCYEYLGTVYYYKQDYTKAVVFYNNSLSLRSKIQNSFHPNIGVCYFLLGSVYREKKAYEEAMANFEKAIEVFQRRYNKTLYIFMLGEVSSTYETLEQTDLSIQKLEIAISIVEKYKFQLKKYKTEKPGEFKYLFYRLFTLYCKQESYELAYQTIERMRNISLFENLNLERVLYLSNISQKDANKIIKLHLELIKLEDLCIKSEDDGNIQYPQKTQDIESELEKLNLELVSKHSGYEKFLSPKIPSVKELQFKLQLYRSYLSSKAKSAQNDYKKITEDRLKNTRKIINYIITPVSKQSSQIHAFLITEKEFKYYFLGEYQGLEMKIHNFREIISTYPNEEGQNPRSFHVVQTPLEEDFLLSFHNSEEFILGKQLYKTVSKWDNGLSNDSIYNYLDRHNKNLTFSREFIGTYYREMDIEEANRLSNSLQREFYNMLLFPIENDFLPDESPSSNDANENLHSSIIVIPDSFLYFIPFSILKDNNNQYLVEQFNVSTIHSLSLCYSIINRYKASATDPYTSPLLLFGNPIYKRGHIDNLLDGSEKSISKGINRGVLELQKRATDILIGRESIFAEILSKLSNLPGGSKEILEIKRVLKEENLENFYTSVRANKDELYRLQEEGKLSNYKILYFSVYCLLFTEAPELNSLILTSGKKAAAFKKKELNNYENKNNIKIIRNEYLRFSDILELEIQSELVILSACESSVGVSHYGEGIANLQFAFLYGGTNNVIANLWPIDDDKTIRFMNGLVFLALDENENIPRSFSDVQRKFIKMENEYSDPFFWSSYIRYGV
ncbi:MAG: tetratricopeptide repeat protein [Leptospiraceae bacterium]|nr:tetratricopeptide repeat protein [Leptospiraceae bacterium]